MKAPKYYGHGRQDTDFISDDALVWEVDEWIILRRVKWNDELKESDLSGLNEAELAVHHTWTVDMEVQNGGFNQYFFNKGVRYIEAVCRAYTLVGATAHLDLFEEAVEQLDFIADAHGRAAGQPSVEKLLAEFSRSYQDNPLNELDNRYYQLNPTIEKILVDFIRRNPDGFVTEE